MKLTLTIGMLLDKVDALLSDSGSENRKIISDWAMQIRQYDDANEIKYEPEDCAQIIFDSLFLLIAADLIDCESPDDATTFLYQKEDFIALKEELNVTMNSVRSRNRHIPKYD